ncbi:MAG: alpha-glucan family phosphorylase [Deltaproteobacteria bacterium]|nr:alpha-glucan family phosphorylase [Deltaproteobacteria bacterium]
MIKPITTLDIKPKIPERLKPLNELANNLWFSWNHEVEELFRRMNPDLWEKLKKNPVEFLGRLSQPELTSFLEDEGFLAHMERIKQDFDRYMAEKSHYTFEKTGRPFTVAYFSAECGVADCLPIYSGGLGILAGDHLKSASDLNLPIVGVSLAYQKGYFRQQLTHEGWQAESYPVNQFNTMPMDLVRDGKGNIVKISLDLKGEEVKVRVWLVNIGRTKLYLLDTNLDENSKEARGITSELYGGDKEMRVRQEIILGIGGVKMLKAIGHDPEIYHMNEGHSAFAVFERIRELKEDKGLSFNEALEFVRTTNVFTTHTPIPAGNDMFHTDLLLPYFDNLARRLGINVEVLFGYGKKDPRDKDEEFCMTVLALRFSNCNNGVSRLHKHVSRKMWQGIWPKTMEADIPIGHVTNGVHIPSWISKGMAENYARYLGPLWIEDPDNAMVWERVDKIPDTELWRTHERGRERLVSVSRGLLRKQLGKRGIPNRDIAILDEVLNSETLTIGFARRFAPYKRAHLILKDLKRLEKILNNKEAPVQIIFAGKAHPQDHMGKELIKQIIDISSKENFRHHMVFLEGFDIEVAQYMVQGVDVWLNTPRRPLEACGTSGMKAVANGALHLSVLDGWWDEGYDPDIGWAIGTRVEYDDHNYQDEIESIALYDILEKDIVPLFYNRGPDGIPRGWLTMMKASLLKLCPMFNTHRMVTEYWTRFYETSVERRLDLMENDWQELRNITKQHEKIMYSWSELEIKDIRMESISEIEIGNSYHVEADIFMGDLFPGDITVEVYYGKLDPLNKYIESATTVMTSNGTAGEKIYQFQADVLFEKVGHFGLNIRITPTHPNPKRRNTMGLIIWGE